MRGPIITWLREITGFDFWSWALPTQSAMLLVAFFVVALVGALRISASKYNLRDYLLGMALCLFSAAFGAHLLSVASNPLKILQNPLKLITFWKGGFSSLGAVALGMTTFGLFLRYRKQSVWGYADILTPVALLGLSVARLGCFLRGCDYGRMTSLPVGIRFPIGTPVYLAHRSHDLVGPYQLWSLPVHPYPLYLSSWSLLLFICFSYFSNQESKTMKHSIGHRSLIIAYLYFGGRFVIEFTRSPFSGYTFGLFNFSQFLCLTAITLLYIFGTKKLEKSHQ